MGGGGLGVDVSLCGDGWTTPVGLAVGSLTNGVPVLSRPALWEEGNCLLDGPRKLGSALKWEELGTFRAGLPGGNEMLVGL